MLCLYGCTRLINSFKVYHIKYVFEIVFRLNCCIFVKFCFILLAYCMVHVSLRQQPRVGMRDEFYCGWSNVMFVCIWQWTGRQRCVRLLPVAMLENDKIDCIKLEENRSCALICTGLTGQGTTTSLCVACRRTICVYELNRSKQRYRRVKEVTCPGTVQYIDICNERLCVGYPSSFAIYSIQGDGAPVGKHCCCER